MKILHRSGIKPGWYSTYIAVAIWALMLAIEAVHHRVRRAVHKAECLDVLTGGTDPSHELVFNLWRRLAEVGQSYQAKVFHQPANHPQMRPYLGPGVIEAQ